MANRGDRLSETTEARKSARRLPPKFDLIAGNVCLDFVNTLDDRYINDRHINDRHNINDRHTNDPQTKPKELLKTYLDLARFGEDTGLLDATQADQLYQRSYMEPDRAQEVLLWGRELRESIHDVFWAILNKRPVPPLALARLNADAQGAAQRMSVVPIERGQMKGRFEWKYDDLRAFDSVLWPIARAAADLLTSDQLPYVRACLSKTCEWFFLDTSKNHHRRWCDMTRCGNRAKGQRFYARKKKESS
ncbi:MAG: ABATE domain-containing protein [Candidatus Sulfotelmatobacter sp.]